MKATKYIAMAAVALAFAACSNDELASVEQHPAANGMKPVEFSTALSNVTRAQIMGESDLTEYWVQANGTFYKEDGSPVTNPKLTLTKSGSTWTYKVNSDDAASTLYWPMEDYTSTFAAWYYDGGSEQGALDNRSAQKDAIGAYATHSSDDEGNTVSLDFKHAVSKAVFQAKLHQSEGNTKIKIDIKEVAFHNVGYAATAYTLPTAETTMGAFTVNTTEKRDLVAARATHSFITEPAGDPAATDLGTPMLVMPQAIEGQDLSATEWNAPYISVLAQIRYDNGEGLAVFPENAGENDYAWIALPLPADFTGFTAHHKYIFTLNFRNDALGKVDRDQDPNDDGGDDDTDDKVAEEDEGTDITPAHSGIALSVTVTEVLDFEEDGDYEVNSNRPTAYTKCPDGNHPHLIDLGLPSGTLWACCNVGATTPEANGDYFAWGETSTKTSYYQSDYNFVNIGSDIAGTSYDAATAIWGASWRMPTKTQVEELINSTTKAWTTQNDVNGYKFTGSNGGEVFLPAAGYRAGTSLEYAGSYGYYWSSTNKDMGSSYLTIFYGDNGGYIYCSYEGRDQGRSVRPVYSN